ncbi:FkbM family methyltransferase [Microbulbifer sp. SAOS-129_SWC]|uniref:FkbM family methyltransferase n=1 Tax=Microbulbifer sp. SAOS-129_SWC TaxID=3145235 RepID=UPI003216F1C8
MTVEHDCDNFSEAEVDGQDPPKDIGTLLMGLMEEANGELLAEMKASWYFGQWDKLASISLNECPHDSDLAIIAALKAAGHQQLNEIDECKKYVRLARRLGCDERLVARLLIAGVHNSLGKISALKGEDTASLDHFDAAVNVGGVSSRRSLARQSRAVTEMAKIGLLPQASKLLKTELEVIRGDDFRGGYFSEKLKVLETEVDLINHQLSLAYKKSQLYRRNGDEALESTGPEVGRSSGQLEELSPSQLGQDLWVLEKTNFKRNGFFVEFGATDGVLLSNTYLLEKEFGWNGICAEPNPQFFAELKKNRDCTVADACIYSKTGEEVEFVLAKEYGGVADEARSGAHGQKVAAYDSIGEKIKLKTISLHDFLVANGAPKNIDYLSVDTEGTEYSILKDFPFDYWSIGCLTVEHNFEPQRELLFELLTNVGYVREERKWDDFYFMPDFFEV